MEILLDLITGIAIGCLLVFVFGILFGIWLLPVEFAKRKNLDQTTVMAIWAMIIIGLFCPLVWILAALIVYYSERR